METLSKLREYLQNTTKEEFENHWREVEGVGVTGVTLNEIKTQIELQPKPVTMPEFFNEMAYVSYDMEEVEYSQAA